MLSKPVAAALGAVALVAAATGAFGVTTLRFWAWASEVREVAGVSYTSLISIKGDRLIIVEDRLERCRREGTRDCTFLAQEAERLRREIRELEVQKQKYGS